MNISKGSGMKPRLMILDAVFAVAQIPPGSKIPSWVDLEGFYAVINTSDEVSIVCDEKCVPEDVQSEVGWKSIMVQGPLDFSLIGILADLSSVLAKAEISIFALSTYNTDYILLKRDQLDEAVRTLKQAGYEILE